MIRRAIRQALAGGAAMILVACAATAEPPATSLVPLVPPDILPVSTPAPSTTLASSSDPSSPLIVALPDTECGYADPLPAGEITFVVGDRLYGAGIDGAIVRCLGQLRAEQRGPVRWSPPATRAVLNSAAVFDVLGTRFSGFDVTNTRVQWEHPDGAGLFAPTATGKTLVRRDAADTTRRTEVTFLATTSAAIAHPAGGVRIATGQASDGTLGIFAASDAGDGLRGLVTITDPVLEVTELGADPAGDAIFFLTDNEVQFRLYQLVLGDLSLTELSSEQAPIQQLTPGLATRSVAWRVGLCNSVTSARVLDGRSGSARVVGEATPIAGQSLSPVGWLDAARLVLSVRPLGCDGPADVWIWNLLDGSATLLAKNVEFPSVRIAAPPAARFAVSDGVQPALI